MPSRIPAAAIVIGQVNGETARRHYVEMECLIINNRARPIAWVRTARWTGDRVNTDPTKVNEHIRQHSGRNLPRAMEALEEEYRRIDEHYRTRNWHPSALPA